MKYICVATIFLVLLLILCSVLSTFVIDAVDETAALLKEAMEAEKDGGRAESLTLLCEASDSWQKHQLFFGTVLRHDEIDDVANEFARLKSYAETTDNDDFLSNCNALLSQLDHITEMEKLSLENIM